MKGVKLNLNMDAVNCVLLVVILALVIYCVVKQNEGFTSHGNTGDNVNHNGEWNNTHARAAAARKRPNGTRREGGFDFKKGIPSRL